ncbi:hypothetical protein FK513_30025, partial [Klebsiella pneumoniae]|nr:hypothetical protein [Klebsiella pneumoniae]
MDKNRVFAQRLRQSVSAAPPGK